MRRREFLQQLALVSVTVACAETKTSGDTTTTTGAKKATSGDGAQKVAAATPAVTPDIPSGLFALGVASGDPLADRVMLWTRLCSNPLIAGGGAPTVPVELAYDVSTNETFTSLVASGLVSATPQQGNAVHLDVTGLQPNTWYYYRFRTATETSPVGRTRTFPEPEDSPEQFKFVFASCQDYQWGYYGGWARAAEVADLDAVVFLGDYIYELSLGDLSPNKSGARVWAAPEPVTLEQYRWRYAQTKSDLSLQKAHQTAPWLITFDDHEVANNYAGDVQEEDRGKPTGRERRLAAYQAWYENMPIRITPEPTSFDSLEVHKTSNFGDLANVYVIETRQSADAPACRGDDVTLTDSGPACDELNDPQRTNLGTEQEQWLIKSLTASSTTWNVLANPLMMAGLNLGTPEAPEIGRDTWDGYPEVRARLLTALQESKVSNPVVVTGDWHANFVLDVKASPDGETIAPEFLASSITTVLFATDYSASNPHLRFFSATHSFGVVTITPSLLTCELHNLADIWDPDTTVSSIDRFEVAAGTHEARKV